ncbi:formimidoylglutamase [Flavobacterium sp. CBA20B-1]|uniref:formimidoylglutamase n=1 Tax=unclassified Flavobacterium TaxID=196869 RepID=UPI0022243174|nr:MULTISPECIES: formimidoylglutamase [unclassified Flavobacterium]WCM42799.1 formimidoylglutamase [Flavobacterium sp. CBA20B-1]
MENFEYFNKTALNKLLILRKDETKFGEKIAIPSQESAQFADFLKNTDAKFIVYGIKEFAGVKANFGRIGQKHAWDVFLPVFLNIQHNKFLKAHHVAVIGCFDFKVYEEEIQQLNPSEPRQLNRLFEIVSEIDKEVTYLNTLIHRAGKKAIVIGGGHNNAYGNIKGLALAKGAAVNVVNFDAHTDFRALEGRHSGNGFSYAFHEGFLNTYCMFGAHENYLNKFMLHQFKEQPERLKLYTFEEVKVRFEKDFQTSINNIQRAIKSKPYGIEIDVDAIENTPSSAMSPSGFSVTEARQFINQTATSSNASYLHLCEGSPSFSTAADNMLGKLLTYLTTDFIKAQLSVVK